MPARKRIVRERGPPAPAAINNKARYWSKVAIFAAVRRSRGHKFAITLGMEKLESLVYQMVKKIKNMFTRFDRIHERDRRTDGQTAYGGIQAALMHSIVQKKTQELYCATLPFWCVF